MSENGKRKRLARLVFEEDGSCVLVRGEVCGSELRFRAPSIAVGMQRVLEEVTFQAAESAPDDVPSPDDRLPNP